MELERRKRANPLAFVEPPNEKILNWWKSTAKVRAIFGGNRSSKTESACIDVLWHLKGEHPHQEVPPAPVNWRCEVSDYNQLEKVVLPKLAKLTPPSLFKSGGWEKSYNSRTHIFSFSNGSKLDFVTHDQNVLALEGAALHGYWGDEEPPHDHYISNVMRTVDYGGKVILSLTPLQGITWVYGDVYIPSLAAGSDIYTTQVSIYENRFLSEEAIREVEDLVTDETDREIRLKGMFRPLGGLVFRKFDPAIHIYNESPKAWDTDFPPWWFVHGVGIDPGWDHPTGVIWLAIDPDTGVHYFYAEHKARQMLPEEHAEIIKENNKFFGIEEPFYVIDSQANATDARGTQVINDYRKYGIGPRLGTKKLLAGNQHLDRLMNWTRDPYGNTETNFMVSAECTEFIKELSTYQRKVDTDEFVDKENDLISAARYVAWEIRNVDWMNYMKERIDRRERLMSGSKMLDEYKNKTKNKLATGY